ncbi:hypothetical protein Q8A67_009468 [Cirrhinus molitorella]|uniref:Uncharacterized protein n=1 Tax=Cirrhinus molitorella TaxID=172907 RepID=A0AA88TPK9_9TELE|nr:hypothetical protein Q8A67_009468 [Cirrhinus molitorella]
MTSDPRHKVHSKASPEPSCLSLKSNGFVQPLSNKTVTSDFSVEMNEDLQQGSHQPVDDVLQRVKKIHKTSMKNKRYRSEVASRSTAESKHQVGETQFGTWRTDQNHTRTTEIFM